MQVFLVIAYLVVGFAQLFAIMDGIGYGLGVGGIISFIVAGFVTYVPLLGSGLGVYGAVNVWDWSIWQAGALFFWYIPFAIMLTLFEGFSRR
ncbi:hypothetical protein NKI12_16400 [Mesorhizobium australicum]|uniref:Uncharacterized protein n=1 Tax=Mesorhizobium australicum TaxID=536018 RepID=A0ACC6SYB1_9HYPH